MNYPSKSIHVGAETLIIHGLSEVDPYFRSISEGFERNFGAICEHVVEPDAVCVDVGANIGVKSLQLSRRAQRGRILAVEPAPKVHAVLLANLATNRAANVTPVQTAVGDREGSVGFIDQSAYGHINATGPKVPLTTLEALMAQHGLTRLDFLKIDVEGFEFPILRHSIDLLRKHRTVTLFEFNSWCQIAHARSDPLAFIEWVVQSFPSVFAISKRGRLLDLVSSPLDLLHRNMTQDGLVTDLLVTSAPERLTPLLAVTLKRGSIRHLAGRILNRIRTRL